MQEVLAKARWWRITPILFITYSFAYLDRVNYAFAAVGGIGRDLDISASTQALIGALFFLGYFAGQIPGAIYAERTSPKKVIFLCLILWGVFSTLTGLVSSIPALMIVRFLLGTVEAAVFPSLLIFVNHWFAKSERSVANSATVLATPVTILWMSILSGYLVHAWGWRAMFVAEGLPASLWGIAWWFLARDWPSEASWLVPEERDAIAAKIAAEQGAIKPVRSYGEAFRSFLVIRLSILYFFWGLSLFGFLLWLPTIIKQGGTANIVNIGWLSAGPYVATTILMPIISAIADRTQQRRLVVLACLAASAVSFLILYALSSPVVLAVLRPAFRRRHRPDFRHRAFLFHPRGCSPEKCRGRRQCDDQQSGGAGWICRLLSGGFGDRIDGQLLLILSADGSFTRNLGDASVFPDQTKLIARRWCQDRIGS